MGPDSRRGATEPAPTPESMDLGERGAFPAPFPGSPAPFPWSSRCLLRVASFFPPDGSLTHLAPAPAAFFFSFFGQKERLSRGQRTGKKSWNARGDAPGGLENTSGTIPIPPGSVWGHKRDFPDRVRGGEQGWKPQQSFPGMVCKAGSASRGFLGITPAAGSSGMRQGGGG